MLRLLYRAAHGDQAAAAGPEGMAVQHVASWDHQADAMASETVCDKGMDLCRSAQMARV
jgi:hypothetical protein